jgi:ankyrin repeat protein
MDLPPPPQDDDPIITQFKPEYGQWKLNDEDIKRINPRERNILHNYCENVNTTPLGVYRYLIETKGCNINAVDKNGNTPLHYALDYFKPSDGGDTTVLIYLLNQHGVNVNIKNQLGYTLLHTACANISQLQIDVFKLLIETYGADVNIRSESDCTPFYYAIQHFKLSRGDNVAVLIYLLNQNYTDPTLLRTACQNINKLPVDVFKCLIETNGGDLNLLNGGDTPIQYAFRHFDPIDGGDINVLTYLINQKGINVNIKGEYDYTLLHYACEKINSLTLEIFQYLVETLGCDVNVQDRGDMTPIHYALSEFNVNDGGDISLLHYLLSQKNADAKNKDLFRDTLLLTACENINQLPLDIFKFLIETMCCDVNVQDESGFTPLHIVLNYFNPRDCSYNTILTYLINQNSINFSIKEQYGRTLLHWACLCEMDDDDDDDDDEDSDDDDVPSEDDLDADSDDDSDDSEVVLDSDYSVVGDKLELEADTFMSEVVESISKQYLEQILAGIIQ